jgi:tellurite resistance protein TerC
VRLARRLFPVTETFEGARFFVQRDSRRYATPLLIALVLVETTDLVFALDSIPAIFSITLDPFIVYTSNVFAILGLRSLYFLLAGAIQRFRYLHYGLAAVLVLVGVKMLIAEVYHLPIALSLGLIAVFLGAAIVASLVGARRGDNASTDQRHGQSVRTRYKTASKIERREWRRRLPGGDRGGRNRWMPFHSASERLLGEGYSCSAV